MNLQQFQKATGAGNDDAQLWFTPMQQAMEKYGINTPKRQAAFLAQIGHESGSLTCVAESLYYKDPVRIAQIFKTGFDLNKNGQVDPAEIEFAKGYVRNSEKLANRAYANRLGNGDEASGDGFRYRGRGPLQTTGKDAYVEATQVTGIDLVSNPDKLKDPVSGALVAAALWKAMGCNVLADIGDMVTITRRVNGAAMLGQADRLARWDAAKKALLA